MTGPTFNLSTKTFALKIRYLLGYCIATALGKVCILDIDVQGVKAVKESGLEGVRYVFMKPPSLEVLEERLRARGTETEEAIEKVRSDRRIEGLPYENQLRHEIG